jgi:ribosomal-protein-alanine N-acetyltransferase
VNDDVVRTERLLLRRFRTSDADFVLLLLNEPSFREYIGDKGVATMADAVAYIEQGPMANFEKFGYGALVVERLEDGERAGMCGLFRRENLDMPDLGFAMLSRYFRLGYATEASLGVIDWARETLRLPRIAAIVDDGNQRSRMLVEKLGFGFVGLYRMPDEDSELRCYTMDLGAD